MIILFILNGNIKCEILTENNISKEEQQKHTHFIFMY